MSWFSRLFGNYKEFEVKKLLAETNKQVENEYRPISEIGKAIIEASVNCRDTIKNIIKIPHEKEQQEREILIFYEFIYFYMHLTLRHAFGKLSQTQMQKMQEYLGPLISSVAIESYFAHWPEDLKQNMTNEFYEKLNDAETEYAECTKNIPPAKTDEERSKQIFQSLFLKLASNVVNLATEEGNISLLPNVVEVALNEWKKMRLNEIMSEIKTIS